MKKDRLVGFKKRLLDKQYQLVQEVGRTALYGKDQEDDSIKDLGDQAVFGIIDPNACSDVHGGH